MRYLLFMIVLLIGCRQDIGPRPKFLYKQGDVVVTKLGKTYIIDEGCYDLGAKMDGYYKKYYRTYDKEGKWESVFEFEIKGLAE